MRKALGLVLAGVGAVTLTSAAIAASRDNHVMTVPLPDGGVATINYVGNVSGFGSTTTTYSSPGGSGGGAAWGVKCCP